MNDNVQRLRDALLAQHVCPECLSPITFDQDEPFAYCSCGTREWGNGRPPLPAVHRENQMMREALTKIAGVKNPKDLFEMIFSPPSASESRSIAQLVLNQIDNPEFTR